MGLCESSVPSNPPVISFPSWNGRCYPPFPDIPWYTHIISYINGNPRILKWRYCTIVQAIFCWDIHLHRPHIGLIYGRYLHFRILKFPLNIYKKQPWPTKCGDARARTVPLGIHRKDHNLNIVVVHILLFVNMPFRSITYISYIYIYIYITITYIHLEFSILLTTKK